MRRLLLSISFFLALFSNGQVPIKDTGFLRADSIRAEIKKREDSIETQKRKEEAARFVENNGRNLDYILRIQKEQRAKQKRNAMVRISIGVVLLIVLIIGLRRKGKKVK